MVEKLLAIPEAAERFGFKPKTIQRWVFLRKITYVRIGHSIRIPESEISRVIEEGTIPRLASQPWPPHEATDKRLSGV